MNDLIDKPSDAKVAERWAGPYLESARAGRSWDNDYKFAAPGKHNPDSYDVWSMGPDGQDGTADDIGNWSYHLQFGNACNMANRPRHHGLTLVEVMLVLALLVVIAAVSMPLLEGSFTRARLQGGG